MHEHGGKLPEWFRTSSLNVKEIKEMRRLMGGLHLNTICESACCPNRYEVMQKRRQLF